MIKRMLKTFVFLALFTPLHWLCTVLLLQNYWFNYEPPAAGELWPKSCHVLAWAFALPIPLPMMMTGLVHETHPMWAQILPFAANSLLWGIFILLLIAWIKRPFSERKRSRRALRTLPT